MKIDALVVPVGLKWRQRCKKQTRYEQKVSSLSEPPTTPFMAYLSFYNELEAGSWLKVDLQSL